MISHNIAIVGAGVAGLASAIALRAEGHKVTVFEQARAFARVGADVNLTPNAVRALDGIGVGEKLRALAARPSHRISRMWDSGEVTSSIEMAETAERSYGAPQLTIHRADLLKALEDVLEPECFRLGRKISGVQVSSDQAVIECDGEPAGAFDLVIGADGIHSRIRHALFGADDPVYTGLVSYRGTFSRTRVNGLENLDAFTKWWGPDASRQIVTFPLSGGDEIFVFATLPIPEQSDESWTSQGDISELRAAYSDFHPQARGLLAACDTVAKSALYVRDPMPVWAKGPAVVIGDAAHPMTPFMAQGACQAIEDSIILSRALTLYDNLTEALDRFQIARQERTARIQIASRGNEWLKTAGNADWVYGYDAWGVEL